MKQEKWNHFNGERYAWILVVLTLASALYVYMILAQTNQKIVQKTLPQIFEGKSILYQTVNHYENILQKNHIKQDNSQVVLEGLNKKVKLHTIVEAAEKDSVNSMQLARKVDTIYNSEMQKTLLYKILFSDASIFYLIFLLSSIYFVYLLVRMFTHKHTHSRSGRAINPI